MTSKAGWVANVEPGQTWTAHDGSVRIVIAVFADDGVREASVRYRDGFVEKTRTISLVTMRGWIMRARAVLS